MSTNSKDSFPYLNFEKYVSRSAVLPLNFFFELTDETFISNEKFKSILENSQILKAIFLASPSYFNVLEEWKKRKMPTSKKSDQRIKRTLVKYLTRMSTRCTPFGIFAGCSSGSFANQTDISLAHYSNHVEKLRIDYSLLTDIWKKSIRKDNTNWKPNKSLYKTGNHWRYFNFDEVKGYRSFTIEAAAASDELEMVINESKNGVSSNKLIDLLISRGHNKDEARNYIESIQERNILEPEFYPSLLDDDFQKQILKKYELSKTINNEIFKEFLKIKTTDNYSLLDLKNIHKKLFEVSQKKENQPTIHCDLFIKSEKNQLSYKILYSIISAFKLLNKISDSSNTNIKNFNEKFRERYGYQEKSLLEVLDKDMGIGYPVNQPEITEFGTKYFISNKETVTHLKWDKTTAILNNKIFEAIHNQEYSITIEDKDFSDFDSNWSDLPDTLFTKIEVLENSGKTYISLDSFNGRTASSIISRFAYGDHEIDNLLKEICFKEQELNPNSEVSEVFHLSNSKIGNVSQRPLHREYEISFFSRPSNPDKEINLSDIVIGINSNKVYLKNRINNKRIIPYLSSPHNTINSSLPVYRFLSLLGNSTARNRINFDLGSLNSIYKFLPRVIYKNIILSKARWIINTIEDVTICDLKDKDNSLLHITKWRKKRKIPKYVSIVEGDNSMVINLENKDSVDLLIDFFKKHKWVLLEEFLHNNDSPIKNKSGEGFANEFVVCFYKKRKDEENISTR